MRGDQVVVVAGRIAAFHDGGYSNSAVLHAEAVVVAVVDAAHRVHAVDNPHPQHLVVVQYSCTLAHFDMAPPRCMDSARAKSSGS
mgnify:CR=1 FL=1